MEQKMKKPVPPELRRAIRFKKRKKIFENIRISIATVIAAFFAILFLMPIVLTITNSFMSSSEISANYGSVFATNDKGGKVYISEKVNLKFIPDIVSFSQYTTVLLKSPEYLLKFWNSVILVGPIVLFQLIVASLASYGFARYSGKLRSLVFFSYVILMLMPYQVTLVPNYLVAEKLNILNTYWAIWLPGIFSPFAVYLLTKFMKRIPVGVMEAAQIDGAGEVSVMITYYSSSEKNIAYETKVSSREKEESEDKKAVLYAIVQRCAVFRSHPCIYRLLEYGGTASDPVIRCGDASLVRILKQDQFRRDRTGIRRGYDLHGAQPFSISLWRRISGRRNYLPGRCQRLGSLIFEDIPAWIRLSEYR